VPGDQILLQVYTNKREPQTASVRYPRGPIDCVPFQAESRTDPLVGTISQYAPYTLTVPETIELGSGTARDLTHVSLSFTNALGEGATVPANYAVTNLTDNQPVQVTEAVIDPGNNTRAILTLPNMPYGTKLRVVVTGVKSAKGTNLTEGKNTAVITVGSAVVFHLLDPYGIIAEVPDPDPEYRSAAPRVYGWRNERLGQ